MVSLPPFSQPDARRVSSWEVHTLTVIAEGHLGLAEANSVLARGNAIELLKFGLVDALHRRMLVVLT